MALQGKRVVILVENNYQEMELYYPLYRFREAGCEVWVVGPEVGKTYTSKLGYPVKSTHAAADLKPGDVDAVIIPGGYAPDLMRTRRPMVELVRGAFDQGKIVAAICHAGWMLASAGIVRGKRLTCVPNIKDDLINAGADYRDQEVVRDGNLITSRVPDDLPAFCGAILQALEEPARAPAVASAKAGR